MKQTVFLISICIAIFFTSCKKVGKVCHVSDPLTELPWLAEKKGERNLYISTVILKDKKKGKRIDGFVIGPNKPDPDGMTIYYNCLGEEICFDGGIGGFICNDYKVIKEENIYVSY